MKQAELGTAVAISAGGTLPVRVPALILTEDPLNIANVVVSGSGLASMDGTYTFDNYINNRPAYVTGTVSFNTGFAVGVGNYIYWNGSTWLIGSVNGAAITFQNIYGSFDDVLTPDLATTWLAPGHPEYLPVPTVAVGVGTTLSFGNQIILTENEIPIVREDSMATTVKISALPAAGTVLSTDLIPIVHDPGGSPVTQETTLAAAMAAAGGALSGTGSPEGAVTGSPGQTYTDLTGGVFTGFWVKVTGTGNTGWFQLL